MAINYFNLGVLAGRSEYTDNAGNTFTKDPDISFNLFLQKLKYYNDALPDFDKSKACDILGIDGIAIYNIQESINTINEFCPAISLIDDFGSIKSFYLFEEDNERDITNLTETVKLNRAFNSLKSLNYEVLFDSFDGTLDQTTIKEYSGLNEIVKIDLGITTSLNQAKAKIRERNIAMANNEITFTSNTQYNLGQVVKFNYQRYRITDKSFNNGVFSYVATDLPEAGYTEDYIGSSGNIYPSPPPKDTLDGITNLFEYSGFYLGNNLLTQPQGTVFNTFLAISNDTWDYTQTEKDANGQYQTIYKTSSSDNFKLSNLALPNLANLMQKPVYFPYAKIDDADNSGIFLTNNQKYILDSQLSGISGISPIPATLNGVFYEPQSAITYNDNINTSHFIEAQIFYQNLSGRTKTKTNYTTQNNDGGNFTLDVCEQIFYEPNSQENRLIWQYNFTSGNWDTFTREDGIIFTIENTTKGSTTATINNYLDISKFAINKGDVIKISVNGNQTQTKTITIL